MRAQWIFFAIKLDYNNKRVDYYYKNTNCFKQKYTEYRNGTDYIQYKNKRYSLLNSKPDIYIDYRGEIVEATDDLLLPTIDYFTNFEVLEFQYKNICRVAAKNNIKLSIEFYNEWDFFDVFKEFILSIIK